MSRRRLALVAFASLVASACASSTTAPSRDESTTPQQKVVTSGSYDEAATRDSTSRVVTSGSY
jgi:hypothetical protein